jgi:hypothetical protein
VAAALGDLPAVENDDLLGVPDGRESVRDRDPLLLAAGEAARRSRARSPQAAEDAAIGDARRALTPLKLRGPSWSRPVVSAERIF